MIQSNFCIHFVNPTQTSSISPSSERLDLLFPSGNWKNANCRLLSYANKFQLVHSGRGLDRHNIYYSNFPVFQATAAFIRKTVACTTHSKTSKTDLHSYILIKCFLDLMSCLFQLSINWKKSDFFFISFHLSCIIKGIKCSQRPAISLLNSCILVFAVNRSSPIFMKKNEGFG